MVAKCAGMSLDGAGSRQVDEARCRTDFGYGHPVTERPPLEPAIVERVHASFARQGAMATLGAELVDVAAGRVAIAVPVERAYPSSTGSSTRASSSPRSTPHAATRRSP